MNQHMVQTQEVIEGWRGVAVAVGLGSPASRAVCAALLAGMGSYAMKMPRSAYGADGSVRATASYKEHFLLTPIVVGTTVYLFT